MPNALNTWTSTGSKLLEHYRAVQRLKELNMGTPISLQIAPTSRCNLACKFCSNANRTKHEDLDLIDIMRFLQMIKPYGLKTVEITGGGDPTMYGRINSLIELCLQMRLEVGMITNGVALKKNVDKDLLNRLAWVRVSTNSLEYVDALDLPEIAGTLGFSLVLHKDLDLIILDKIVDLSEKHSPAYIRIVPDCLIPKDQIDEVNELNKRKIEWVKDASGQPFFYQDKQFDTPERCWWGYFKPFLLHDCYVYPCSSVVLNTGADGKFHEKYRWYRMEDVETMYQNKMVSFPTDSCDKCVFTGQNEMVDDLIHPNKMVNFI